MKKPILTLALFLAAVAAHAQVKMVVTAGGRRVGTAVATRVIKANQKSDSLSFNIEIGQTPGTIKETMVVTDKGMPVRQEIVVTAKSGQVSKVTATFTSTGARVTGSGGLNKTVPLPKGASAVDPSELWFYKVAPRAGTKVSYWSLDPQTLKWEKHTVTYVGKKQITVGGKKVSAHEVKLIDAGGEQTQVFVDAKGMPYRIESRGLVFERV